MSRPRQELADYDPDALAAVFSERPALHRYPRAMAARTQDLARLIVDRYDGDPAQLWTGAATGEELVRRIAELPGFGATKAQIFAALLGKQLGVRPPGWQEATGPFGQEGSRISVADITDRDSLAEVRAYKQQRKAAAKAAEVDARDPVQARHWPGPRRCSCCTRGTPGKKAARTGWAARSP